MRVDNRTYIITQPRGYTGFGIYPKSSPSKTDDKSIREITTNLMQVADESGWGLQAMVDQSSKTPFVRFELFPGLTPREDAPITKASFLKLASDTLTGGKCIVLGSNFREHVVTPAAA